MGLSIFTGTMASTSHALVFDCRSHLGEVAQGQKDFDAGPILGVQHASLNQHLTTAPVDGGSPPLLEREVLADQFQQWGIHPETRIICYDQNNGAFAARLWWLFRRLGHDNAFVFDGGLDGRIQQGLSVSTLQETFPQGHFTPRATLANICQIAGVLGSSKTILNAPASARYRGEVEPIDAVTGHIPGAISDPLSESTSEGYFKPKAVLERRFETPDLTLDSFDNVLALLIAGYSGPALYPGSPSEWITDPDRPIETA